MINLRGIEALCKDYTKIENYDKAMADATQTWDCHHRMEAVYTRAELIKYGLYYDREPHQLIFLTRAEHNEFHHRGNQYCKGKKHPFSEEHKAKIAAAHKGKKRKPFTDETRAKMSAAATARNTGRHWKLVDGKRVWY